ncbi:hypothetical protein DAEQUDRAFT_419894 [Daedalea quercina L-15889]|uniref:Uncharacterized protein n=1 Tax=Daedalea quercina L-15889 TaxID=1314783 RepID=A0A165TKS6_9APHY|nr:hypothetical protein DAEQUDRAFT_419894 [Daedalea quercina L-15889]
MHDAPNIDFTLLKQGHIVGRGRVFQQRSPRLGILPYAQPAFPMSTSVFQDLHFAAPGQFSACSGQTSTLGGLPFGQPSQGQGPPGFDAWEVSFMADPLTELLTWGTPISAPPFDVPFSAACPAPRTRYQPQMVHSMASVAETTYFAVAGPSRQPNQLMFYAGAVAAPGSGCSSASAAGSIHSIGAGVSQSHSSRFLVKFMRKSLAFMLYQDQSRPGSYAPALLIAVPLSSFANSSLLLNPAIVASSCSLLPLYTR